MECWQLEGSRLHIWSRTHSPLSAADRCIAAVFRNERSANLRHMSIASVMHRGGISDCWPSPRWARACPRFTARRAAVTCPSMSRVVLCCRRVTNRIATRWWRGCRRRRASRNPRGHDSRSLGRRPSSLQHIQAGAAGIHHQVDIGVRRLCLPCRPTLPRRRVAAAHCCAAAP